MNTEQLKKVIQEFMEYELDPGKIDTKKIHDKLMMIKDTIDLSSPAAILNANAAIASLLQVISFKAGKCSYWEGRLKSQLEYQRIQVKYQLLDATKAPGGTKMTKEEVEDRVEMDPNVMEIKERLLGAELGRKYWDRMLDILSAVAHRVDSNGMQLGVQAKMKPQQI
jgi:hypothetical protein